MELGTAAGSIDPALLLALFGKDEGPARRLLGLGGLAPPLQPLAPPLAGAQEASQLVQRMQGLSRTAAIAAASSLRDRESAIPVKRRARTSWWQDMMNPAVTNAKQWRAQMRLPRNVFAAVLKMIERDAVFFTRSNVGSRAAPVDKQLACFLLRVGNCVSTTTTAHNLGISPSTVVVSTRRVIDAITRCCAGVLGMPLNGSAAKAKVKSLFKLRGFDGGVGIVDCTPMRIVVPAHEVRAAHMPAYMNRKFTATLTFQCVTDCARSPRFLDVSGGLPGSAYDTKVMAASTIYKFMDRYVRPGEYFLADVGYVLRPQMQTGFKQSEMAKVSEYERRRMHRYNKTFSGTRISVERGFGILKARFKGIGSKLDFRGETAIVYYQRSFLACTMLHNICCDMKAVSCLRCHLPVLTSAPSHCCTTHSPITLSLRPCSPRRARRTLERPLRK
jgi:hypothetical protein